MSRKRQVPSLTASMIDDEHALGEAIDGVLRRHPELRATGKAVQRQQGKLRASLDDRAWQLFLELDALAGDRASVVQEVLVRWAFSEGVRAGRRRA